MGNTELANGFQPWLYTNISSGSFPNTNAQASPQANELILSKGRTHTSAFYFKAPQVILMYRQDCKPLSWSTGCMQ